MSRMTDKLKPCPFCGHKVNAELEQQTRWIYCPNCEQGIDPIFDKIVANLIEIDYLKQIRDILLPKLISGELEIGK